MNSSLEERLDQLENTIAGFTINQKMLSSAYGYTQNDAKGLESEITATVQNFLYQTKNDMLLYKPEAFMQLLRHPTNDKFLTDLDGVLILTNDGQISSMHYQLSQETRMALQPGQSARKQAANQMGIPSQTKTSQLVIVEAKHHVTPDRIEKKLAQMRDIESFLTVAQGDLSGTTARFKSNVQMFKLKSFSPHVLFYIGGVYWDNKALEEAYRLRKENPDKIGIVKVNGSRFSVIDDIVSCPVQPCESGGRQIKHTTKRLTAKK